MHADDDEKVYINNKDLYADDDKMYTHEHVQMMIKYTYIMKTCMLMMMIKYTYITNTI